MKWNEIMFSFFVWMWAQYINTYLLQYKPYERINCLSLRAFASTQIFLIISSHFLVLNQFVGKIHQKIYLEIRLDSISNLMKQLKLKIVFKWNFIIFFSSLLSFISLLKRLNLTFNLRLFFNCKGFTITTHIRFSEHINELYLLCNCFVLYLFS